MVSADVLASCVSLVDADGNGLYVRHYQSYLRVDSVYAAADLKIFDLDSSFIVLADTFYPGLYALKSVNRPDHYVKAHADSRLGIVLSSNSVDFYETASFRVHTPCKSIHFRVFLQIHIFRSIKSRPKRIYLHSFIGVA